MLPEILPGTLNALNAPSQEPAGLRLPGYQFGNEPIAPPLREPSLGDIGGTLARLAGAGMSIPKILAWNAGPAIVGRSGQGPQNGAELFGSLGLDPESPWQRAAGHGLGAALDMAADPVNLLGMGVGRAATPAASEGGALTRRLERMVAPVNEANAAGRPIMQSRIDNWNRGMGIIPEPFAPGAGGPFANAGARARVRPTPELPPTVPGGGPPPELPSTVPGGGGPPPVVAGPRSRGSWAGMPGSVSGFGYDADALRSMQLNSPHFNPDAPVFGLGTAHFSQDPWLAARQGAPGAPSLLTERLGQMSSGPLPTVGRPTTRLPGRSDTLPNGY